MFIAPHRPLPLVMRMTRSLAALAFREVGMAALLDAFRRLTSTLFRTLGFPPPPPPPPPDGHCGPDPACLLHLRSRGELRRPSVIWAVVLDRLDAAADVAGGGHWALADLEI